MNSSPFIRHEVVFDRPLRLARLCGHILVLQGRVWLTRRGDLDDHVLAAGARFAIEPADDVVIEPFGGAGRARLAWRPQPTPDRWFVRQRTLFAAGDLS